MPADRRNVSLAPPKRWRFLKLLAALAALIAIAGFAGWKLMIEMPGRSYHGPLQPLPPAELSLRDELREDVEHLAVTIGERNLERYGALCDAAKFVESQFLAVGYEVDRQSYEARECECFNLEVEIEGAKRPEEIVIVGAHYDSAVGAPGANDNASGTAALLALARRFAKSQPERTLRFVAFTNEEPPYFQRREMGSWIYANQCSQRNEKLVCVLSLETMGYYTDEPDSQQYPPPFGAAYPSVGNFIAVIGDVGSRKLVHEVVASFRRHAEFPSEGGAVPSAVPGAGWSDHWSFWQVGYPAVMITDTAPFRYPYYHMPEDTPDKLDFDRMARVVAALEAVVGEFAGAKPGPK
ncbi:MAG TPA: M28 family peptidase [Pirellulales bacterium]|nr:M28 family peptidase [Pirellulales bacterium]